MALRPGWRDAELLEQFIQDQDEEAFATLVRHHAALVYGVCRRILRHTQDAEDAFQATFLILARKARSIRRHQFLAGWLYQVAFRTALRAREMQALRKVRENEAFEHRAMCMAPASALDGVGEVLDEEVRRLPAKYRAPILLCYLQGQTNEEAARRLSCPTGTVKVRLSRARELLRRRLVRRRAAFSVAALLSACLEQAHAGAPPHLVVSSAATTAGLSAKAGGLANQVLRSMVLARIKASISVLMTALLLALANMLAGQAHGATFQYPTPIKPAVLPASPDSEGTNPGLPALLVKQVPARTPQRS
jgi:RNA polymerase sigma-70 factor (ECF subfamily)